jgi:hypothetical protein
MILHVVGDEQDFEPQQALSEIEHEEFFLTRIRDLAGDSVHLFEDASDTKATLTRMAAGQVSFDAGAQEISRRFSLGHVRSSRDGAFFVLELSCELPDTKLFALLKYDYRQAIELYEHEGRNALRQIFQAFIKEKRAIQKFCLVRVQGGVVQAAVSAHDRMGTAPDPTDYFQKFLDLRRERNDFELNTALKEAVRASFEACSSMLPPGRVPQAVAEAKELLRDREQIDDEAIQEAIYVAAGRPQDENVRAELEKVVAQQLRKKRLSGITFTPDPSVLRRAPRRRITTAEGVQIVFPGEEENRAVTKTETLDGVTIVIKSSEKLVEDGTLSENARRRA